ncbi:hypothetical protein L873DRAFT_1929353 [Choiromyces venosus 120613-1]|uniref:Methyltransferase n=1 Tax=Choiromyces venosus 120613-1 TaxID=1336337 RepID=A0A3N4JC28_9PEZI|nr:hypothetical protein L873DRAFT_1929353 [Choiromyces venosus 120613-1]
MPIHGSAPDDLKSISSSVRRRISGWVYKAKSTAHKMSTTTTVKISEYDKIVKLEKPNTVQTNLWYLKPGFTAKPTFVSVTVPSVFESSNVEHEAYLHEVTDVRGHESLFSLDKSGFEFIQNAIPDEIVQHIRNNEDEEIEKKYYPRIEELLKKHTGANRVFIFDHTIRKRIPKYASDGRGPVGARQSALRVHVDQAPSAGTGRVKRHLPNEAEELLKGRVQIINVWRPLVGPVEDHPLAVADYRSVKPEDLVVTDLLYPGHTGEMYSVLYNPEHKWYYKSRQQNDEVILIKCFDSKTDRARVTPHSAIKDPTSPENPRLRESIEIRALVFHTQDRD